MTRRRGRAAPLPERFWAQVARGGGSDACWLWTGLRYHGGYGRIDVRHAGRRWTFLAHRVAWALSNGPIPEGMRVCHGCDTPSCCNPAHLFLGTQADNVADMVAKGRHRSGNGWATRRMGDPGLTRHVRGERHGCAKLTEATVLAIRRRYAAGARQGELTQEYGMSQSQISRIVSGQTWKHLPLVRHPGQAEAWLATRGHGLRGRIPAPPGGASL